MFIEISLLTESNLLVSYSYQSNNTLYNLWNNKCFILKMSVLGLTSISQSRWHPTRVVWNGWNRVPPHKQLYPFEPAKTAHFGLCVWSCQWLVVRNLCEFIYWCSKLHCFGQKPPKCSRRHRQRRTELREKSVPSSPGPTNPVAGPLVCRLVDHGLFPQIENP